MAMRLETVVSFGRSLVEYRQMFNLTEDDLKLRLLGVGDGPAIFNAQATQFDSREVRILTPSSRNSASKDTGSKWCGWNTNCKKAGIKCCD